MDWKYNCPKIDHDGYTGYHVYEKNLGCSRAHRLIAHIIDHGSESLRHISCEVRHYRDSTFGGAFSYGEKIYRCFGYTHNGTEIVLKFALSANL